MSSIVTAEVAARDSALAMAAARVWREPASVEDAALEEGLEELRALADQDQVLGASGGCAPRILARRSSAVSRMALRTPEVMLAGRFS